MSKNFYTTTTAALKATTANIRQIDAKQIKLNGESIPSKVLDDRGDFVTDQDLWGTSITTDANGVVHVSHKFINTSNTWNRSVKSVKDNKAYTSTDASGEPLCNIQTERIKDGTKMFFRTDLALFSSNLSSLDNGDRMFQKTSLTSFSSDTSSLVNGNQMFALSSLTSFSSNLSSLVNGNLMFGITSLTSFSGDLSSLVNGEDMFTQTPLSSFSSDLSSLVNGSTMFYETSLTSFSGDLSSLINGSFMFCDTSLTSFSGDLSSLVDGIAMFRSCKLTPQSVMYIIESIRNITEEKAKYINGEIPWVTYDSETKKYSKPFGFMENGSYVYTYKSPNPTTTAASDAGELTLGIDVTNDSSTIEQQLQTFAEGCLFDSWAELKQEFVNKGWTVTFQYGGTTTGITLSEDEQFRGTPVYARLIEVTPAGEEYTEKEKASAEYCTEDGTKYYNIDWGHDVTDYDKYQYFGSLLEACGYYGVIPKKYLEEN